MTRTHTIADHIGKKSGLPPGTLVHIGERRLDEPKITIIEYDDDAFSARELKEFVPGKAFPDRDAVTWINVDGVHEPKTIEALGSAYGLHPLVLEDVMNTHQRPKLEEYEECLFVVLKMLDVDDKTGHIMVEQVSVVVGKSFVITFQERAGDVFDDVRDRLKRSLGKIRKMKADYLAYRLVDAIVDNYFVALDAMGDVLEELEERITFDPTKVDARDLHTLKREMLFLRKAIHPARELLGTFSRIEDSDVVRGTTMVYLRDVYDHCVQVSDTLEVQRDILASMLDVYHSAVANRMNQVMKVLTIFSALFMPVTFLAGIYGMNFENMPELKTQYGYFVVVGIMATIIGAEIAVFRHLKWI